MRYVIIGLGIYGANLARDLTEMGHEVIGADINQSNVDAIKDYISTVYLVDCTEEAAMSALPLRGADMVIVAIGENFGASVKTVAILKKMEVKHIYARAIDDLHESILESFKVDRILAPEQRAASDLSLELAFGTKVQTLQIDVDNYIVKFAASDYFIGLPYTHLDVLSDHNLQLIAATRPRQRDNVLHVSHTVQEIIDITDPDLKVTDGDILTIFGSRNNIKQLIRYI